MEFEEYYKKKGYGKDPYNWHKDSFIVNEIEKAWDYQQKEIDKITKITTDYVGVKLEQITQLKEELKKEREIVDSIEPKATTCDACYKCNPSQFLKFYKGKYTNGCMSCLRRKARQRQKERTIKA